MTVSERVGVSCLSAVLGSVLPLISALAQPAGFQTNSPEHVARSAVPAGPPAALQSCRPQCKQVAVPPRSKNGHAEWVSGDRKKIPKIPTDLQPCLCSPKNGDSSFGLSAFFFRFFFVRRRIVRHKCELSFAQLVVASGGFGILFMCVSK